MSFMFQPCRPCCKGFVKPPPPPSPGSVLVTTLDLCSGLSHFNLPGVTCKLIGPDGNTLSTDVSKINFQNGLAQTTLTGISKAGQYTVVASYTYNSNYINPSGIHGLPIVFDNGGVSTLSKTLNITQDNISQFQLVSFKLSSPPHTVNIGVSSNNENSLPAGTPILVDGVQKSSFVVGGVDFSVNSGNWVSVEPHNQHTISVPSNSRFSGWSVPVGPYTDLCTYNETFVISPTSASNTVSIPIFCGGTPISTTLILTDSTYGNCTLIYSPTSASWVGTKTVSVAACGSCPTQSVPVTYELLPGGNASGTGFTVYLNLSCPIYTGPSNFLTFGLVGCPWPDINNSSVSTQHFGFNANLTNLVCPTPSNKLQVSFDLNVQLGFNLGGILAWQCARTTTFFITEG